MILVTGGTGFVGPKVVQALRAGERDVRCLVRKPEQAGALKAWGCELAAGDVTDPGSLESAPSTAARPSSTSSRSSSASRSDFERVMVEGTRNLVAAARDAGVRRIVLMSALGVAEGSKGLVPVLRGEMGDGAGGDGVGPRSRDLPAELRVRT